MMQTDLGTFSFTYRSLGVHGVGISASSNFAVLYEASQLYLYNGPPLSSREVARAALRFERHMAHSNAIAADDVYPIVYGGLVRVVTRPNTKVDDEVVDGDVLVEPVSHEPRWIADHVVVAFDPAGERHRAPLLLGRLFEHPDAVRFVERLSALADRAGRAIGAEDLTDLAALVHDYNGLLNEWSAGAFTANVERVARRLEGQLGKQVLAWKPPGGGATLSLMVVAADRVARDAVLAFFEAEGWWATPALITGGVYGEFLKSKGKVRLTAGHRLDFVGAADLGQDLHIGKEGCCCSCAIEPRAEILVSVAQFRSSHPIHLGHRP
jgi:hypothetical protein